jgi:hypothetical protein
LLRLVLAGEAAGLGVPFAGSLINEFTPAPGRIITEEQRLSAVIADLAEKYILIRRGRILRTTLNAVLKKPMWVGDRGRDVHARENDALRCKFLSRPEFAFHIHGGVRQNPDRCGGRADPSITHKVLT